MIKKVWTLGGRRRRWSRTSQDLSQATGSVTESVTGSVTGSVTRSVTGLVTRFVTGSVTGSVTRFVTGSVTGSVTGFVSAPASFGIEKQTRFSELLVVICAQILTLGGRMRRCNFWP